jgi:hypothetical protein
MTLCAVQQFVAAQSLKSKHCNIFNGTLMDPMDQTPYQTVNPSFWIGGLMVSTTIFSVEVKMKMERQVATRRALCGSISLMKSRSRA